MEQIQIEVSGNIAKIKSRPARITSGTVGLRVTFSFDGPWATLNKTAVFRAGRIQRVVENISTVVTIPWEVLQTPKQQLSIGVYGVNESGTIVIPTIWANAGSIQVGVDPEGDPATEPTPPLWKRMEQDMENLEAQVNQIVNEVRQSVDNEAQVREANDKNLDAKIYQETAERESAYAVLQEDYIGRDMEIWDRVNQDEASHRLVHENLDGKITQCQKELGVLSALGTENKNSAVEAINEVLDVAQQKETFVADYNNTLLAEILEAKAAGKVCVCSYNRYLLSLTDADATGAVFTCWTFPCIYLTCLVDADDAWSVVTRNYYKTTGITADSTDDQVPTAAAVYRAMLSAGSEPEIFIGYEETSTWGDLSRQIGYGKLVFVQENKVTRRLHQYYGYDDSSGVMRFYRVDGDGIHWLAVDRDDVWTSGKQTGNVFVGDANTTPQQIYDAFNAGKVCFVHRGNAGEGMVVYSAIPNSASAAALTRVTSYGQIEYGWLRSDGTFDKTTISIVDSISASSRDNQIPTAKAVYNALKEAGASGEFDGEDGGYYTPEFDDIGGGLIEVNFHKSKEAMPNVPMKQLYLPEGLPGKSAYDYAQEAGYGGTEKEFGEKLAQDAELFLVTIANKPGAITADKTYAEIKAAYQAGKIVVLRYASYPYFPLSNDPAGITFYPMVTEVVAPAANRKWTVTSADVWSYEYADIPFATTEVTADSTDGALPTAKAVWDVIPGRANPKYELIQSLEVTEPVRKLEFTDLNLDELTIFMEAPKVETAIGHDVYVYNTEGTSVFYHWPSGGIYTDYPRNSCWHMNRNKGYVEGFYSIQTIASASHTLAPKGSMMTHSFVDGSLPFDRIKMDTYDNTKLFPVGTKIEIWGVRADA